MKKRGKRKRKMAEERKRDLWYEIGRRTRIQQASDESAGEICEW